MPSPSRATAVIAWVAPAAIVGVAGVTVTVATPWKTNTPLVGLGRPPDVAAGLIALTVT